MIATARAHITALVDTFRALGVERISLSARRGGDIAVIDVDVTVASGAEVTSLAALLDAAPPRLVGSEVETFATLGACTVWIRSSSEFPRQGSS